MQLSKQVHKDHYSFLQYVDKNRWMSYYYQIKEILSLREVKSVLEIGPGASLIGDVLAQQRNQYIYKTLDIAEDLNPDFLGSTTDIPIEDNAFDVVVACQILEHIPYSIVPRALSEIARVSKKHVIISLPHSGPALSLQCKIPMIPQIEFVIKIPYPKKHVFDGEHYWEIGRRGFSRRKVRSLLSNDFRIEKEYVPFENPRHRFYLLTKR